MSFIPTRPVLLCLLAITVVCAKHGMAQSRDTVSSKSVDHNTMTAEQHAALQDRGKMAMGVDQYASAHEFDVLPYGGRITLEMKDNDSLAIAQIRAHLKLIQHAFQAGDFSTPEFVHMRAMPGTDVMRRKTNLIAYTYADLPRGGEVRITTTDPESLVAIRKFMGAQRGDHNAGG